MDSSWTDNDDTERFWKYVKDLRDGRSIVKEELPNRLKDAASENPDLFVRLIDEMIRVHETRRSSRARKCFSRQGIGGGHLSFGADHRTRRFDRMSPTDIDDVSHCHSLCNKSVISYSPSNDEVEVEMSFGHTQENDIEIYNSLNADHDEIEPIFVCDKADDNASIAKSIIMFEPDTEVVEVGHLAIHMDDNVSQVSNVSYATEVASVIRNLRERVASNNRLASGMAREMDEVSKKERKPKVKTSVDLEGFDKWMYVGKTKNRSPINQEINVRIAPSDNRDDISLLSENEFSQDVKKEVVPDSSSKSKGRNGVFRRILNKSKKMTLPKPQRGKIAKPSRCEASPKAMKDGADITRPQTLSIKGLEVINNEQRKHEGMVESKEKDEVHAPTILPPYVCKHVLSPVSNRVDAKSLQIPNYDKNDVLWSSAISGQKSSRHSVLMNRESPDTLKVQSRNSSYDGQGANHADKSLSRQGFDNYTAVFTGRDEISDDRVTVASNGRGSFLLSDEDDSELNVVATVKLVATPTTEPDDKFTDDAMMAILGPQVTGENITFNSNSVLQKRTEVLGNKNDIGNHIHSSKKEMSKVEILTDLTDAEPRNHAYPNPPANSKLPMSTPSGMNNPFESPTNKMCRSYKSPSRNNSPKLSRKNPSFRSPVNKSILKNRGSKETISTRHGSGPDEEMPGRDDFLFGLPDASDSKFLRSNEEPISEIVKSDDRKKSSDDRYTSLTFQEPKKPTFDDGVTSQVNVSRWFRKEFMEMAVGSDPTGSIDHSISDGYSHEDSYRSYSSYSLSADGTSDDGGNPAAGLLEAVQSIFGVK